jgi:hypothetical protein
MSNVYSFIFYYPNLSIQMVIIYVYSLLPFILDSVKLNYLTSYIKLGDAPRVAARIFTKVKNQI